MSIIQKGTIITMYYIGTTLFCFLNFVFDLGHSIIIFQSIMEFIVKLNISAREHYNTSILAARNKAFLY